jgi:hypothetical protein
LFGSRRADGESLLFEPPGGVGDVAVGLRRGPLGGGLPLGVGHRARVAPRLFGPGHRLAPRRERLLRRRDLLRHGRQRFLCRQYRRGRPAAPVRVGRARVGRVHRAPHR